MAKIKGNIEATKEINVGVPSFDVFPAGIILPYGGASAPSGALFCDGSTVSRTTYSNLYAIQGNAYGEGDGSTTFHLPDTRGRFIRGVDGGVGRDPDRSSRTASNTGGNTGDAIGSVQNDDYKSHNHITNTTSQINSDWGDVSGPTVFASNAVNADTQSSEPSGGNETRPKNLNCNYIITTGGQ